MNRLEQSMKFWEERHQYWEKWLLVNDLIRQLQYEHEKHSLSRVNEVAWQIVKESGSDVEP